MTELSQLEFSVRYRLGEYPDFASEHAFATWDSFGLIRMPGSNTQLKEV